MYGRPCWNVKPGYGSSITLEFGKPHLEIREPIIASTRHLKVRRLFARRNVFVHGEWHLHIYDCAWEVLNNDKHVGNGSTKRSMQRAAKLLDGQKLIKFSFTPKDLQCLFEFDLGGALKTVPYDGKGEQWILFTPERKVLILRADRCYQYVPADVPRKGVWKPALHKQ